MVSSGFTEREWYWITISNKRTLCSVEVRLISLSNFRDMPMSCLACWRRARSWMMEGVSAFNWSVECHLDWMRSSFLPHHSAGSRGEGANHCSNWRDRCARMIGRTQQRLGDDMISTFPSMLGKKQGSWHGSGRGAFCIQTVEHHFCRTPHRQRIQGKKITTCVPKGSLELVLWTVF